MLSPSRNLPLLHSTAKSPYPTWSLTNPPHRLSQLVTATPFNADALCFLDGHAITETTALFNSCTIRFGSHHSFRFYDGTTPTMATTTTASSASGPPPVSAAPASSLPPAGSLGGGGPYHPQAPPINPGKTQHNLNNNNNNKGQCELDLYFYYKKGN